MAGAYTVDGAGFSVTGHVLGKGRVIHVDVGGGEDRPGAGTTRPKPRDPKMAIKLLGEQFNAQTDKPFRISKTSGRPRSGQLARA